MRRSVIALAAALMAAASTASVSLPAQAATARGSAIAVRMDQSVRISLKGAAQSVVVGNPTIADVSVIDARTILVLGKGYGVTNLVIIDAYGRTLFDREIVVSAADSGRVSVWRGPSSTSYACAPRCEQEPAPQGAAAPAPASSGTP